MLCKMTTSNFFFFFYSNLLFCQSELLVDSCDSQVTFLLCNTLEKPFIQFTYRLTYEPLLHYLLLSYGAVPSIVETVVPQRMKNRFLFFAAENLTVMPQWSQTIVSNTEKTMLCLWHEKRLQRGKSLLLISCVHPPLLTFLLFNFFSSVFRFYFIF